MKYVLYAVEGEGERLAVRMTPSSLFEWDRLYWQDRLMQKVDLVPLTSPLPVAEAAVKLERMMKHDDSRVLQQQGSMIHLSHSVDSLRSLESESFKFLQYISGRVLLWEEGEELFRRWQADSDSETVVSFLQLIQFLYLEGKVTIRGGVERVEKKEKGKLSSAQAYVCHRCGATESSFLYRSECARCYTDCVYCERCLVMGKSRSCTPLLYVPTCGLIGVDESGKMDVAPGIGSQGHSFMPPAVVDQIKLTPSQHEAAERAVNLVRDHPVAGIEHQPRKLLIHAVCGAGKTEVMFPAVNEAILQGKKVLIAIPRKDVVLELAPRFRAAFPDLKIVELYGGSEQKWEQGELTIATTHQVLRFYQNFDVVITDEVDAFPFHNNPMLYDAVRRAAVPSAALIYLSATPPRSLLRELHSINRQWRNRRDPRDPGNIVTIPARYHGHPLPVPVIKAVPRFHRYLEDARPLPILNQFIRDVFREDRQAFIFVPYITESLRLYQYLLRTFSAEDGGELELEPLVEVVHSLHPKRTAIVERFRKGEIRLLITTTILERGVTVPKTDVLVWRADTPAVFDDASLIQIAGRAGRSAKYPDGCVWFLCEQKNKAQHEAIRNIRRMNRLAMHRGLLQR